VNENSAWVRRSTGILLAVSFALAAADARAQGGAGDRAIARGLFFEARKLMEQQRFAEACPKLEESLRLDFGNGTQFNLATCYEQTGRTASAWALYSDVAAAAKAAGQSDREQVARRRATAMEAVMPQLTIEVAGAPEGLEIRRDGAVVAESVWGTAVPIDPGSYAIAATAPGRDAWRSVVSVGPSGRIVVRVPELAHAPIALTAAAVARPSEEPVRATAPARIQAAPTTWSTQRTTAAVVGGAGIAGLAVATGFTVASFASRNEASSHCDASNACDTDGLRLRHDAVERGRVATIALGASGALLAVGAVLWLTAPTTFAPSTAKVHIVPSFGPRAASVAVGGAF
jgi:serine/threonine-protein kinase